jgi:hypothetical protein
LDTLSVDLLAELFAHDDGSMTARLWDELNGPGPEGRLRKFTFDAFDVDLDLTGGTAVVHDVVDAERSYLPAR